MNKGPYSRQPMPFQSRWAANFDTAVLLLLILSPIAIAVWIVV